MKNKNEPGRFVVVFIVLFLLFYYFNIVFFGLTNPGNHYNSFLADHLNYIHYLRWFLLHASAQILKWMGFAAITNEYELLVAGHNAIKLVYSCLGLGLISFLGAFVLAYPKPIKAKIIFLITSILAIEMLNIVRFILLVLFWNKRASKIIDHHTIFNFFIYIIIAVSLYFWVKYDKEPTKSNAKN